MAMPSGLLPACQSANLGSHARRSAKHAGPNASFVLPGLQFLFRRHRLWRDDAPGGFLRMLDTLDNAVDHDEDGVKVVSRGDSVEPGSKMTRHDQANVPFPNAETNSIAFERVLL